jgi:hypothetical protein
MLFCLTVLSTASNSRILHFALHSCNIYCKCQNNEIWFGDELGVLTLIKFDYIFIKVYDTLILRKTANKEVKQNFTMKMKNKLVKVKILI